MRVDYSRRGRRRYFHFHRARNRDVFAAMVLSLRVNIARRLLLDKNLTVLLRNKIAQRRKI